MDPAEVKVWRRAERARLIALRMALSPAERRAMGERLAVALQEIISARPGTLGVYWPFRAEFDPLPVVIDKKGPLEYRAWAPGEPLIAGVWDIPIPEKREIVVPSMVLAPVVGFDRACYRLGYGGGYFDRTLGALDPRPLAIGIGFAAQEIATIHPQPFDIAMDMVVTENGVIRR
jgi:5-formyltetrahydrofolate cyclo-ligase